MSTKKWDDALFQISVSAAAQFLHKQEPSSVLIHRWVRRSLAMFARQCLLLHTSSATCVCFCITVLLYCTTACPFKLVLLHKCYCLCLLLQWNFWKKLSMTKAPNCVKTYFWIIIIILTTREDWTLGDHCSWKPIANMVHFTSTKMHLLYHHSPPHSESASLPPWWCTSRTSSAPPPWWTCCLP